MSCIARRRAKFAAFLVSAFLCAFLWAPASSPAAPVSGTIDGTVRDNLGVTGLPGIDVYLWETTASVSFSQSASTDANGYFAFPALEAGRDYFVSFYDAQPPYYWAPQMYNGHFALPRLGDPVPVTAGATTTISANLQISATVNGSIHRLNHPEQPIAGAQLYILWMGEAPQVASKQSMDTTANGAIQALRGLTPGPWMIWARMSDTAGLYGPTLFGSDIRTLGAGTTTTVDIGLPLKPQSVSNYPGGWVKAGYHLAPTVANGDLPPFVTYTKTGEGTASTNGFILSEVATQTFNYWSVDASNNVEATKSVEVHVDGHAPQTVCAAASGTVVPKLTLSAEDPVPASGLAATYYQVDGGAVRTYTSPVTLTSGEHYARFWSVDRVGNSEATQTIRVDNPLTVVLGKPNCAWKVKSKKAFKVTGSIAPRPRVGDRSTKILAYKSVNGVWKLGSTHTATSIRKNGKALYSANVRLRTKGYWKLVAYSPGTYAWRWPGTSAPKYVRVR